MLQYGYLEVFINELRSNGRYTFSSVDLRNKYSQSDEAIKKALRRLKDKQEIAIVRKEFYAITPPEFRGKGMFQPSLFINELMQFLERDYYVGLLNAAAFFGAANLQSQDFSVITTKPTLREIHNTTLKINFYTKKEWSRADIVQKKVETGYINVSSPELTALDMVFFFDEVGGFNRITSVLEELIERMDAQKLAETAKRFYQITTVQRLGFLLSEVLQKQELSKPLAEYVKTVKCFPVLLRPQKEKPENMVTGNEWKVVQNIEIEAEI